VRSGSQTWGSLRRLALLLFFPETTRKHLCALVVYVPLTTQNRGSRYEIELGRVRFLNEMSVANVQGIGSIPAIRLQRRLGLLSTEILDRIKQAIRFALDL
jgi:mRNA interferase MazF